MSRQRAARLSAWMFLAMGLVGMALGDWLGVSYTDRLPDHRGVYLVTVRDELVTPAPDPRHGVLVVVDGLRRDAAEGMRSFARAREHGRCFATDVGSMSVSRPVYAVLSAGLEQDRSGSRNNDCKDPLVAQSFWEIARQAGRRVIGASQSTFWQELFPHGFSTYTTFEQSEDLYTPTELGDLNLFHPLYVDESGHDHGGTSPEYRAAVDRADRELSSLLDRLDFDRDTVVLTSDHGHSAQGGHGARQPEIAITLTCFAGRGVVRAGDTQSLSATAVGPALTVLLGLPFPANMRATDDDLDKIWTIVDEATMPAGYLLDRKDAVQKFRQESSARISGWSGGTATSWDGFYALGRLKQTRWASIWIALIGLGLALHASRKRGTVERVRTAAWIAAVDVCTCLLYALIRGSFDYSSINTRRVFLTNGIFVVASVSVLGAIIHFRIFRSLVALREDAAVLAATTLTLLIAHIAVYGWPVGYPLPPQPLAFFPYFGGIALTLQSALLVVVGALALRRSVAGSEESAEP